MTLQSASILEGWRNDRDNLTVNDYRLIKADLENAGGGTGDVVGPGSSIDQEIMVADGTTGKLIAGSGVTISQLLANIFSGALQVDAATTAPLTGTWTYNNLGGVGDTLTKTTNGAFQTVDTVVSAINKTYLLKNEVNQLTNGKWQLTTQGTAGTASVLTRTTDSDTAVEFDAQVILVGGGSLAGNLRKVFSQTTPLPAPGTNNIVYASSSAAGLGAPLTRTVAQMQTLKAASGFQAGRGYIITALNPGANIVCNALFIATSVNSISSTGWCKAFSNSVIITPVEVKVEYDLDNDFVSSIYRPLTNVLLTKQTDAVGYNAFKNWPLDAADIRGVTVNNGYSVNVGLGALISDSVFFKGPINIADGCTFIGISKNASIALAGTASFSGTVGSGATLKMFGTQNLTSCTIGDGKTADFTSGKFIDSYTRTGRTYAGNFSDFDLSATDLAGDDSLDMALNGGVLSMSNFKWAGILKVSGDNTQKLNEFTFFPTDHSWTIIPDNGIGTVVLINSKPGGSTNIYLETNTFITLQGSTNPVDRAVFQADEQDNSLVVKIGGANYVV